MNGFVVMSGLPASGKSTLGNHLAAALDMTILDKDSLLERAFQDQPVEDLESRARLSRAADRELQRLARSLRCAVLVSFWRHPDVAESSGTSTDWLAGLDGPLVEVHCQCAAAVAADRFLARQRHPGHFDVRHERSQLIARFEMLEKRGPLGLGTVLVVNTGAPVGLETLLPRVKNALNANA